MKWISCRKEGWKYEERKSETENMESYPHEGSIKELDDCIVINF